MDLIEQTARRNLSQDAQKEAADISHIRSFCSKIIENSLNVKIHDALAYRKQGHFDKAMLNVSEANRDQVTAVRRIQNLIGQDVGKQYPEVVFEKFRQFEPFEIGLSEGDAVLSILARFDDEELPLFRENKSKLHDSELQKVDEENYLNFLKNRLNDATSSDEIEKSMESIAGLDASLMEQRNWIIEKIFVVVGEALKELPAGIDRDRILLELSQNINLVVLSPILTKPASLVEFER